MPFAYRLLGRKIFGVPFITGVPFIWGATPGVPFITWGLMAYRFVGGVVLDLAKINIIGEFWG